MLRRAACMLPRGILSTARAGWASLTHELVDGVASCSSSSSSSQQATGTSAYATQGTPVRLGDAGEGAAQCSCSSSAAPTATARAGSEGQGWTSLPSWRRPPPQSSPSSSSSSSSSSSPSKAAFSTSTSSSFSSSSSTHSSDGAAQVAPSGTILDTLGLSDVPGATEEQVDKLMEALLQPLSPSSIWRGQLNHALLRVDGQMLVEPQKVLLSTIRALHVMRAVLEENGHIYIIGNNPLLKPLVRAAARSCLNPNVWFYTSQWKPGMITNAASHRRFFKERHHPNRRVLAAKGLAMVNPHCPRPPPASATLPRLDWPDKWQLFRMSHSRKVSDSLRHLMALEEELFRFKPQGSLRGEMRHLSLLVFLDSTRNSVGIAEAYQRNIPTIALVNSVKDLSQITYPVLARDFHPEFVHFFLDWIVKVVNVAPQQLEEQ